MAMKKLVHLEEICPERGNEYAAAPDRFVSLNDKPQENEHEHAPAQDKFVQLKEIYLAEEGLYQRAVGVTGETEETQPKIGEGYQMATEELLQLDEIYPERNSEYDTIRNQQRQINRFTPTEELTFASDEETMSQQQ